MDTAFARCYPMLVAWCRRHVPVYLGEPEDHVHQAYLRCRRSWRPETRLPRQEMAYFLRAVRWVVADSLRRRRRHPETVVTEEALPPRGGTDPLREMLALEALTTLSPRERAVCAIGSQALVSTMSAGAHATHASRAKAKLRRHFDLSGPVYRN